MTPARPRITTLPRITILLCTHQGAAHLQAQLDSYLAQHHRDWDLWVSDDGSQDDTRAILARFADRHGAGRAIRLIEGPRAGEPAANYLSALCHPDFPSGPVALSDQDDVWLPGKLSRALRRLERVDGPALYGAQYFHTDAALRPFGASSPPAQPPSFGNALVQNIVSGHSAVLNAPALALVRAAGVPRGVPYHDWWLYQLVTGAGGTVIIDPRRVLLYRQHGANAMGAHRGWRARLTRARQVLGRTYAGWLLANRAGLQAAAPHLTPEARATLAALARGPRAGPGRAWLFHRLGLRRQTGLTQAVLLTAALLGRI